MVLDYFDPPIAYNPDAEDLVTGATFQVFAVDDSAYATPLPVTDPASGANISVLASNNVGVLPAFRVAGDPAQVVLKSGSFTTLLTSRYGIFLEVVPNPTSFAEGIAAAQEARLAAEAALEEIGPAVAATLASQDIPGKAAEAVGLEIAARSLVNTVLHGTQATGVIEGVARRGTPTFVGGSLTSGVLRGGATNPPDEVLKFMVDAEGQFTSWTVEVRWTNPTVPSAQRIAIGIDNWWWIGVTSEGKAVARVDYGGTARFISMPSSLSAGTHDIALVADAGVCSLYVDGIRVATDSGVASASSGLYDYFGIGGYGPSSASLDWCNVAGWKVDEVRISDFAQYSAATYDPPPTGEYQPIVGTVLLAHLSDASFLTYPEGGAVGWPPRPAGASQVIWTGDGSSPMPTDAQPRDLIFGVVI